MKVKLYGVDALGKVQRLGKNVVAFESADRYARLHREAGSLNLTLITPKDCYTLQRMRVTGFANRLTKHYEGQCKGVTVKVVLRKVSGTLTYEKE